MVRDYKQGGLYGVIKLSPLGQKCIVHHVHRAMYMCIHKKIDLNAHYDVSHLCLNNNKCVNIDHLVLEPHETNMECLECKNYKFCNGNHDPPLHVSRLVPHYFYI